jgi:alkylhydroperoxidase/carboxymuconolactone decarboxylase family protein YurZ
VWSRPVLTVAARRLLTIGALTAAGIREVVLHLSHYAGWGAAAKANNAAEAAIARHEGDGVGG